MKWIYTAFVLLFSFSANCQNYTFPTGTQIFDIEGPNFLAVKVEGSTAHLRLIDENLGEVWADSISFGSYADSIYINGIDQFGSSDKYMLSLKRVIGASYPDPSFLWTSVYDWDFQFSTFSIANQGFIASARDTFHTLGGLNTLSYNDSTIYFMDRQLMICPPSIPKMYVQSYEMSSDLSSSAHINSITGQQNSIPCVPLTTLTLARFNDEIQWSSHFENASNMIYLDTLMNYTGSLLEFHPNPFASSNPSANVMYTERLNRDSLLVLINWTTSSGTAGYWQLNVFSEDLQTINSANGSIPNIPGVGNYQLARATRIHDKIYILGVRDIPGVDDWTVFVYDFDMNLVCEIPVSSWVAQNTATTKSIVNLNDKAYFILRDLNSNYYYEVGCNVNALSENDENAFNLYPNPATSKLTLEFDNKVPRELKIADLKGNVLYRKTIHLGELDVSMLSGGLYFLIADFEDGTVGVKRFVKQ